MFESMYIGISGLSAYSKGLNIISNNLANMNTAGFKGSTLNFGDMFYRQQAGSGDQAGQGDSQYGTGVNVLGTHLNFRAGEVRQTGSALDLSIAGNGYFITRNASGGEQRYTRAGQLAFDRDGVLVNSTTGRRIAGLGATGALTDVTLDGLRTHAPTATTTIVLGGILSTTATSTGSVTVPITVQSLKVIDSRGGEHLLSANFTKNADNTFAVKVLDGSIEVASGTLGFLGGGTPDPAASTLSFTYTPGGAAAQSLSLQLGPNASAYSSGNSSSLAMTSQDGVALGTLVSTTINADGFVVATYTNGKTRQGTQLALGSLADDSLLQATENGEFSLRDSAALSVGRPGQNGLGTLSGGQFEGSNVDLATEFTDLIVMQRGYQASSRVVSTANDLIQELFDMKGHR